MEITRLLQKCPPRGSQTDPKVLTRTVIRSVLKTFGYRDHRIVDAQYMEQYMEAGGEEC